MSDNKESISWSIALQVTQAVGKSITILKKKLRLNRIKNRGQNEPEQYKNQDYKYLRPTFYQIVKIYTWVILLAYIIGLYILFSLGSTNFSLNSIGNYTANAI